jgi:hypothetical protein
MINEYDAKIAAIVKQMPGPLPLPIEGASKGLWDAYNAVCVVRQLATARIRALLKEQREEEARLFAPLREIRLRVYAIGAF